METIIKIVGFLFLGLLISTPFLLLLTLKKINTKWNFLVYFIMGLIVLAILMFTIAWWSHESYLILLKHYGYNIDGINDIEIYGKVSPINMEKVKGLETSIMGIGWTLKAIFGYVFTIPYLIFIYLANMLINRLKNTK